MALVEAWRFDDPHEGLIAAAALRSAGVYAWCQAEGWGALDVRKRRVFGFPLWCDAADRPAVQDFIRSCNPTDPAALAWWRDPRALTWSPVVLVALLDSLFTGWLVAGVRRRPDAIRIGVLVAWLAFIAWIMAVRLSRQFG